MLAFVSRTASLVILASTGAAAYTCPCGPAKASGGARDAAALLGRAAAIDIPRRRGPGSDTYLDDINTQAFFTKAPFARATPAPFVDRRDADSARGACAPPFVIGGVNCDDAIRRAKTLTGISLEDLSLRMRGTLKYGSYNPRKDAGEWADANGTWMRTSSEGWIDRLFLYGTSTTRPRTAVRGEVSRLLDAEARGELRRLLVNDNRDVRARGFSHQDIARPLLTAIQNHIDTGQTKFDFAGRTFTLETKGMGGAVDLWSNEGAEVVRRRDSGWTGRGVQGSPFNDELFANVVYEFRNDAGETLTIDGVTPHLIYRYGFYQGGPYRTEPAAIEKFFGMKAPPPDRRPNCPP